MVHSMFVWEFDMKRSFATIAAAFLLAAPAAAQDWAGTMAVTFATGSAAVAPEEAEKLDLIARTFREGDFIVVEVAGIADTVGAPAGNLRLSSRRAEAVADGLIARGLSPLQLQLVARGNGELAVETDDEVAEARNRVAEISWR